MKNLFLSLFVGFLGWQAYSGYLEERSPISEGLEAAALAAPVVHRSAPVVRNTPASSPFSCDGRTHCSQMGSCEEAIYHLRNCPGVKMDGDGDGVPCERQWCR